MTKRLRELVDLLEKTNTDFKKLEKEASVALFEKHKPDVYQYKMKRRAELLKNLPKKIRSRNIGLKNDFELFKIESFAAEAREALKDKTGFRLATLLTWPGSKKNDPNDLERLIKYLKKKLKMNP